MIELQNYQQCFDSMYVLVLFITELSTETVDVDNAVNHPPYDTLNTTRD